MILGLPRRFFSKRLFLLRHGQAAHNPRAEAAKALGCTHDTFLELMRQDDAFDAPLTILGEQQAVECREKFQLKLEDVELVVSSPLSRALKTADMVLPHNDGRKRIAYEEFRELNGWLLNAKRRNRSDLEEQFDEGWDFSQLTETDERWTETLEDQSACAERAYQGLIWLMSQKEDTILLVCHGGLLRFVMTEHSNVVVKDGRDERLKRFGNCELREFVISCDAEEEGTVCNEVATNEQNTRPVFTLTETSYTEDIQNGDSVEAGVVN